MSRPASHLLPVSVVTRDQVIIVKRPRAQVDGVADKITSLGVWRTGVRAVQLESLMLLTNRGYPAAHHG
jgi:hypothetical protein